MKDPKILPEVTSDEIDMDLQDERDDEIARDMPPHHN